MARIPTGLFNRGSKLLGVASRVALSEMSSRLKSWEDEKSKLEARVELAKVFVKTLSEMKGASMKVGQLLSLDVGDYLPPEVQQVLESLQQSSSFLPFPAIETILRNELGDRLAELSNLSRTPLAAASIGQVHTARLGDEEVVVKIQYPGVADSIPQDIRLLEILLRQLSKLARKDIDLDPFMREVEEVLRLETDYRNELRMLELYGRNFQGSPYLIPRAFSGYSTQKVIVLERLYGKSIKEWKEKSFISERQKLAHQLLTLYLSEFFVQGLVQTDPNPGNFLITEQGQLALLDFGAVKEYPRSFVDGYRMILLSAYAKDRQRLLAESVRLGFIDERESEEVKELYLEMMEILAEPFRSREPFNFSDKKFLEQSRDLSWEVTRRCKFSPPPKELLFLHRKLAGVFGLVSKLEVKIVLNDYWKIVEDPATPLW